MCPQGTAGLRREAPGKMGMWPNGSWAGEGGKGVQDTAEGLQGFRVKHRPSPQCSSSQAEPPKAPTIQLRGCS